MRFVAQGVLWLNEDIPLNPKMKISGSIYFQLNPHIVFEVENTQANTVVVESFIRKIKENKNCRRFYLRTFIDPASPFQMGL